jgi:hypothetical protein
MKYALIIGNNKYNDSKLAQLKTPAADSQALAKILEDESIGSFDEVTPLVNQTESRVRRAISAFLTDKKPDDLVLLYFSGHGVLDDRGRLYLALKDTQLNILKATSIPSSFLTDEMDSCRSKRQILILDCCHSGAFARGTKGPGQKAITETTFEGSGFGRVVLTASDSTQYALEGDQVIKQTELSLFTHFLLDGLKTGEADVNNDGQISLDEWYDYTYAKVISETPRQVPHKWSYNQRGDLVIARNPYFKKKVAELPYELVQALESPFVGIRESAVHEVGKYLKSRDPEVVALAIASLKKMREDDSRRISSLAEKMLSEAEPAHTPGIPGKISSSTGASDTAPEAIADSGINLAASSKSAPEQRDVSTHTELPAPPQVTELESGTVTATPDLDKRSAPAHTPIVAQSSGADILLWSKWIVIAIVGFSILRPLQIYLYDYKIITSVPILFALVIGIVSLVQWFVLRNQLRNWWIAGNLAGGILLGGFTNLLYETSEWWGKDILFIVLFIANFILGSILLRKTQEEQGKDSQAIAAEPLTPFIEANPRQNLFVMLLSIFLIVFGFRSLITVASDSGFFYTPDGLANASWTLYGILSILAGVSFFLTKDMPRNFGLVMLAAFLILNGIIVEVFTFAHESSLYLFNLPGIASLLASVYFVTQRETWKYLRSILLCCYLILVSLVYFGADISYNSFVFSILTVISALLAGVFFFLRK